MKLEELKAKRRELMSEANKLSGQIRVMEKEWPQIEDLYLYLVHDKVLSSFYDGGRIDQERAITGLYRTKQEAEIARDKIREFVQNGFKEVK